VTPHILTFTPINQAQPVILRTESQLRSSGMFQSGESGSEANPPG